MNLRDAVGRPSMAPKMNRSRRPLRPPVRFLSFVILLLAVVLGGCAGTRLDKSHPLVTRDAAEPAAKVYFIRPFTDRYLGFADNIITIEAERAELMRLVKGEYTLVSLKPGNIRLSVRNDTSFGAEFNHKELTRSVQFTFEAGQTYFLVLKPFDGEFRGVHFAMETIDVTRARELSKHLRVIGPARSAPISKL